VTTSLEPPATAVRTAAEPAVAGPGWVGRAALAVAVGGLVLKGWVAFRGYFLVDDFIFQARAAREPFLSNLLTEHAGHVMPGGMLVAWLTTEAAPLNHTAVVVTILAAVATSYALCWRMLTTLVGARPAALVPFVFYCFTPLLLPATVWWAAALNALPLQMAGFAAVTAYVRLRRTGDVRQLTICLLAVATGLLFFETGAEIARDGDLPPQVRAEILKRVKGMKGTVDGKGAGTLIGDGFAAAWHRTPGGVIVVAARALPPAEAARIREIATAYDEYHQVRLLDDPIRASYVGILILITLLIVFAASWMGIYLARQITVPVQLLAEGTEEVARGNLDVSLDYQSRDEFGTLVASFNRMTADLKAMKGNLEETNASLTRTYDELRRRTQFIETILHSISTGVIVIDRHGRIAMINKVAERLLRIATDGAVGRLYREVLREEHYEAIRSLYREAGEAGGGQVERQVELVVGEKRIAFRVSLTSLRDDAGEYMGLVAAFDDLSQAMRLQRVLAWREVARRIAHDIRNPLTPIQLSTERMRRKYAAAHAEDPVFAECTQAILSEVNTLKHLVDEFTRFARMPVPRLKEGDLPVEIRTVVDTYRTSHPGIRWEFRQEGSPRVWFDPFQIRRAVTNLLDNAAAALGERGSVTVSCTHDETAGKARIDVADDGPGIPPGDRDRLFEPYFSRREGGTGLGLAIVSAIASDHGGTVRMRDNTPQGTVFEMEFPAQPPAKGKGASTSPGIDDGRRRN